MNELTKDQIIAIWGIGSMAIVAVAVLLIFLGIIWAAPVIYYKVFATIGIIGFVSFLAAYFVSDVAD